MSASDINRRCIRAVGDACRQLNERLAPYKQSMKGAKFEEIVRTAHMDRVDLSAHGWYITPDITGELRLAPLDSPLAAASLLYRSVALVPSLVRCCEVRLRLEKFDTAHGLAWRGH